MEVEDGCEGHSRRGTAAEAEGGHFDRGSRRGGRDRREGDAPRNARRTAHLDSTAATALDVEQAITDAQTSASNAAVTAQTATGPALEAAQEAAHIARIGYREGKFGQLDLLDAERTLAQTRLAAIDALASYQNARAQLERLTAPAPEQGN